VQKKIKNFDELYQAHLEALIDLEKNKIQSNFEHNVELAKSNNIHKI